MSNSPYQSPRSTIQDNRDDDFEVAGNWRRFFNYFIDGFAVMLIVFGIFMGIALMGQSGVEFIQDPLMSNLMFVLIFLFYYTIMESMLGRTIGKFITGTHVVTEDGEKPSFGKALLRTLSRFVPFEFISFFFGEPGGWHDKWTNTYVVRK